MTNLQMLVPAGPSTAILDHLFPMFQAHWPHFSYMASLLPGCLWMLPIILSPAKKVTFSKSAFYSILNQALSSLLLRNNCPITFLVSQ